MQPFILLAANRFLVSHMNAATNQSIAKYPYRSAYALLQYVWLIILQSLFSLKGQPVISFHSFLLKVWKLSVLLKFNFPPVVYTRGGWNAALNILFQRNHMKHQVAVTFHDWRYELHFSLM